MPPAASVAVESPPEYPARRSSGSATCAIVGPAAALGGVLLLAARPGGRFAGAVGAGLGVAGAGCAVVAWPLLLGGHAVARPAFPTDSPTPGRALRWIGASLVVTTLAATWAAAELGEPALIGVASVAYVGAVGTTWAGTNATFRAIDRSGALVVHARPTREGLHVGVAWTVRR